MSRSMYEAVQMPGYAGPFTTLCLQELDRVMERRKMPDMRQLLVCANRIADRILLFHVEQIPVAGEAEEFAGAMRLTLGSGEVVILVPKAAEYKTGACALMYEKGEVGALEIDMALAELIEMIELGQTYLM